MARTNEIIPFLAGIVEQNTHSYKTDFAYDEKRLQAAMLEASQENRIFLWMSRPCGTHCVLEREAFIRETGAHSIWTHYEYDAGHIKAFRIIIEHGCKGDCVRGKIQPLNYAEQIQRVKRNAVDVHTVELSFEDGEKLAVPFDDYRAQFHGLLAEHGKIKSIVYKPENEAELTAVLKAERVISAVEKRIQQKKKAKVR